jgi:hypothetical protein
MADVNSTLLVITVNINRSSRHINSKAETSIIEKMTKPHAVHNRYILFTKTKIDWEKKD